MRSITALAGASLLALVMTCADVGAQANGKQNLSRWNRGARTGGIDSELARSRAEVIEKIKETRAGAEKLLELHESERQRRAEQYGRQRELYIQGLIARNDVLLAEQALADATRKVDEDKRWIAESDSILMEATMRDELLRLPSLGVGAYSESGTLLRFNGRSLWRLADVSKIEAFFFENFGRALPISARGQTATHDRLRFDHQQAIDVALHPDSTEGRSLLNYLRGAGIPFTAFRSAISGSATGAHIHIGKPSSRL
jgi:hypothetical protein